MSTKKKMRADNRHLRRDNRGLRNMLDAKISAQLAALEYEKKLRDRLYHQRERLRKAQPGILTRIWRRIWGSSATCPQRNAGAQ